MSDRFYLKTRVSLTLLTLIRESAIPKKIQTSIKKWCHDITGSSEIKNWRQYTHCFILHVQSEIHNFPVIRYLLMSLIGVSLTSVPTFSSKEFVRPQCLKGFALGKTTGYQVFLYQWMHSANLLTQPDPNTFKRFFCDNEIY